MGKLMASGEVVLNLWYVRDDEGVIYSLRAKAYVVEGSDEQKLAFLQARAALDYLIAESFSVPERFHLAVGATRMPVGHVAMLQSLDSPIALFEDAVRVLEDRFPAQSNLAVPQDPLVCTTPLVQNPAGVIVPSIEGDESGTERKAGVASWVLKNAFHAFRNVACERRDFRCAPKIKHIGMCMISPGRPWPGTRLLKAAFQQPASAALSAVDALPVAAAPARPACHSGWEGRGCR